MSTQIGTVVDSKKAHLHPQNGEKTGLQRGKSQAAEKKIMNKGCSARERKLALLQDVDNLKKKLRHEENVHRALERALTRPLGARPRFPPYLPQYTLELLAEVAVLEEEVVRLEEQVMSFRQGLYREALCMSSRRSTEDPMPSRCDPLTRTSRKIHSRSLSQSEVNSGSFEPWPSSSLPRSASSRKFLSSPDVVSNGVRHCLGRLMNCEQEQPQNGVESEANKISEDILKCLIGTFLRLSTPKRKTMDTPSFSSLATRACSENNNLESHIRDPYFDFQEVKKRDVGAYSHLYAIDAGSFDLNQKTNASFLIRRLKLLLDDLASAKLDGLKHQQKLAFWINIYNSCIMNAFLENGIPESPENIVELMQKAKIKVGGHVLNALMIEHFILRLPYHLKYADARSDEMKACRAFGLEWPEPLVTFALSCGSWSSPAVMVYTASGIESELERAKQDYLAAAVGVSPTNKLIIPELLDWYLLDFAKDLDALLDWLSLQLPDQHRNEALKCLETKGKEPLSKFVQVSPYNFRFRYLIHQ